MPKMELDLQTRDIIEICCKGWNDLSDLEEQIRQQFDDHELVAVCYETSQAYGGPEEGGWWYVENHVTEFTRFECGPTWADQLAKAEVEIDRLRSIHTSDDDDAFTSVRASEHYRFSLELVAQGEEFAGEMTTTERPHYE